MHRLARISARWLGVGLAATLSAVTMGLALTGRLNLFINPESNWFAISMAVLALLGTAASFLLPLGAEDDHGHDHGTGAHVVSETPRMTVAERRAAERRAAEAAETERIEAVRPARVGGEALATAALDPTAFATRAQYRAAVDQAQVPLARTDDDPPAHHAHRHDAHAHQAHDAAAEAAYAHAHPPRGFWGTTAVVVGGAVASAVVIAALVLPPRSLSAELALSRDLGSPPLFGGADVVQLATTGDLSKFGVGQWATVFQTAPDPRAFDGTEITLTGFVAPATDGSPDAMRLTRLVITHCVIDAQPATLPVEAAKWQRSYRVGEWVTIVGKVREADDGKLVVVPDTVTAITEPTDPYEY